MGIIFLYVLYKGEFMKKTTILLSLIGLFLTSSLFGTEGAAQIQELAKNDLGKWAAIAAALAIGLSVLGAAAAQGRAGAAALEGITRNPGSSKAVFVPMLLVLALIESLAIYGLIIAFSLVGKF